MGRKRIAIVGIGLRYPDASDPAQLWDNVLAGRRAFRRLPAERMNPADYYSADPAAPDRYYTTRAAVLRDFEFDRSGYRVAGSTYRSTDLTHWLALDTAATALADAGFPDGADLPGARTGVVVGNSLTGEFARANIMRLRWPYVRRTLAAALTEKGWDDDAIAEFTRELEPRYKAPFPAIDEDSLAGGLSNTIAGRICNHFDFGGGGYTVDGACSSSLLSVATAAGALADGDLDAAVAGGVDLSIDPFEVIGFAKTGALATGEMKVYDKGSNGFWPGEGCGMLVLMREEDAADRGLRIYATVTGWGISSDGRGGITRPEAVGHRLALTRAYDRAGYGVETVSYFEGHGTGTALGDATEIQALTETRRAAGADAPAALSTIKGNFGHTKAAAGVAGLIKATLAVFHQVIPPATGHREAHPALSDGEPALYVPSRPQPWPDAVPPRAGVSALGFGGINTHIALEQAAGVRRRAALDEATIALARGRQDAELLLFDGPDAAGLRAKAERTAGLVGKLSSAELTDLAAGLAAELSGAELRAAVVASDVDEAELRLGRLQDLLAAGAGGETISPADGVFLSQRSGRPRVTFLFPGQGSGHGEVGAIRRRFAAAEAAFAQADLPAGGDQAATEVAQPRIVTGSLAGLRVLAELGITADRAVGHSLGELTALHWGGALSEDRLQALAAVRGQVMAEASQGGGGMAGLAAPPERVAELIGDARVVVAGYNGPRQTVLSGPAADVDAVCERAQEAGVNAVRINVSHAFHSPLVAPAARAMSDRLSEVDFQPLAGSVVSSVTGNPLPADTDLRKLLVDQVLEPVRFHDAARAAADGADLVLEVGPGRVLTGLHTEIAPDVPVVAVDTDSASISPLLTAVGAAFALGAPVRVPALFDGRLARPLPPDDEMRFLANPCETAPEFDGDDGPALTGAPEDATPEVTAGDGGESTMDLLRRIAASRAELPVEMIHPETRPLDDLHLSSITVSQLINDAVRSLGLPALEVTTNLATVGLGELAETIDQLAATAGDGKGDPDGTDAGEVPGVATWVHPLALHHVEMPAPRPVEPASNRAEWAVYAPDGDELAEPLSRALAVAGLGDGVLLCLPEDGSTEVALMLAAARAALADTRRFVVVQHRFGASGLARTLHLEAPSVPTTIITIDGGPPDIEAVVADIAATTGFAEVRHGPDGTRTKPVLRAVVPSATVPDASPLDGGDVLLVTGGAKGITAECALVMAQDSGAKLALLGRADPVADEEVSANLERMSAAGIEVRYERADVTSAEQVTAAVERFEAELGTVTAILHGAGRNEPNALTGLTEKQFQQTLAPKVTGLRTVLDAVDQDRIGLLVTFGSIIGRAGLRGEAHYSTANDWLTELTVRFGQEHPNARVLALEWSVWSGAGMGEKLGVVEALMRDGITPIPVEQGVAILRQVLADPGAGPVLVISGRTGGLPTVDLDRPELPVYRFLDRVLVHYPNVELVTEADLSEGSDPYLADHELDGDLLFPAVIGMEAMAQTAAAVTGSSGVPALTDMEFLRPIVVRPGEPTTIRIAALVRDADTVSVAIRSAETSFGADHFRATLRPRGSLPEADALPAAELPPVPVDPIGDLYGEVLFQGKRFQRLLGYRKASARHAVAEIGAGATAPWFAPFLAQQQVLADPGARDAIMHALQCCVPDATLLPERLERLVPRTDRSADYLIADAHERSQDGDAYTYDIDVRDPDGTLVERWEGLTLRAVRKRDDSGPWAPVLLGSLVERGLERVAGGHRAVIVEPVASPDTESGAEPAAEPTPSRRDRGDLALSRALDGRERPHPESDGDVSVAHTEGLTMAVLGAPGTALVAATEADWGELLGADGRAVADRLAAAGEKKRIACARVWAARECLRAAGGNGGVTTTEAGDGGWTVLGTASGGVATWATSIPGRPEEVVFAVLTGAR